MPFPPIPHSPLVRIDNLVLNRKRLSQITDELSTNPSLVLQIQSATILPEVTAAASLSFVLGACIGMSYWTFEGVSLATLAPVLTALLGYYRIWQRSGRGVRDHWPLSTVKTMELRSCTINDLNALMVLMHLCPALKTLELLGCEVDQTESRPLAANLSRIHKLKVRVTSGMSGTAWTAGEADTLKALLLLAERVEVRAGLEGDVVLARDALLALDGGGVQDLRIDGWSWECEMVDVYSELLAPPIAGSFPPVDSADATAGMLGFRPALRTLNLRALTLAGMALCGTEALAKDWMTPLLEATRADALEHVRIEVEADFSAPAPQPHAVDWGRVDAVLEHHARRLQRVHVVLTHECVDDAQLRLQVEYHMYGLAVAIDAALPNLSARRRIVTFSPVFRDVSL